MRLEFFPIVLINFHLFSPLKYNTMASNDSGGIYCFFPFERFDHKGNGVFKIGILLMACGSSAF